MIYVLMLTFLTLAGNSQQRTIGDFQLKQTAGRDFQWERKQINKMIREKGHRKISAKQRARLTNNFIIYGSIWEINPVLAACVGWKESTFKEKIRRGGAGEVGIMQIIPWEKTTRQGYKICTGNKKRATRRQLGKLETNLCIGIYELNEKRWRVRRLIKWYKKRNRLRHCIWHNPKYWSYRHRKLFKKHPHLRKYFWVAAYNWGPNRIYKRSKSKWDPIGYPIRVLKCFHKYGNFPKIKKVKITATTVKFTSGSRKLKKNKAAKHTLKLLAKSLKEDKSLSIKLIGHTDSIGSRRSNKRLSRKRAKKIRKILLKHGVPKSQLSYSGKGEANPIATNKTKEGRALNRRVDLELFKTVVVKGGKMAKVEKELVKLRTLVGPGTSWSAYKAVEERSLAMQAALVLSSELLKDLWRHGQACAGDSFAEYFGDQVDMVEERIVAALTGDC